MCYWSSSATITNCTISGNTAPFGGAVCCEYDGSATITNSIVWGNTPEQIYPPSDQLTVTYCNVQGGWPGEGNIETDPVFAEPDSGDYHLKSVAGRWDPNANDGAGGWVIDEVHSFCIDAGDPASDYSNEPLPNGEWVNVGAYGNTIYASKSAPVVTISGYTWDTNDVGIEGVWLSADNGGGSARTNDGGHYVLSVLSGWSGTVTPEKFLWSFEPPYRMYEDVAEDKFNQNYIGRRPTVFYVDDDAPGDPGPGDPDVSDPLEDGTPEHPFDAIQEGIDITLAGDTVLVADGVYTGNGNRDLDFGGKDIIVRSENGPHYSIIDCEGSESDPHGGFFFYRGETDAAVVDGFTITNGDVGYGCGGGIHCSQGSPTIANCAITGNAADEGGGVYCWGDNTSPTITNCTITGNTAGWDGGGVYCEYGNLSITNCLISGNTAIEDGGGGCFRFWANGTITNCTITGNTAKDDGGGVSCQLYSVLAVTNSIVWGNIPSQIHVSGGTLDLRYSNISTDPLFVDPDNGDYRLSAGSPCIDAADNEAVPADGLDLDGDGDTDEPIPFDLDGNPRFIDDLDTEDTGNPDPDYPELPIVDMGAYELQIPGDLNGDGCVDQVDLGILLADWGCTGGDCPGDCDHDGDTDQGDLGLLLAHWGQGCP